MNSCFFIGHADAPEEVFAQLTQTVERLIVKENVGYFYVGGVHVVACYLLRLIESIREIKV